MSGVLKIEEFDLQVKELRKIWMSTSSKLETKQTKSELANIRLENVTKQPLSFRFPQKFDGKIPKYKSNRIKAAVLREKGSNSEERWLI